MAKQEVKKLDNGGTEVTDYLDDNHKPVEKDKATQAIVTESDKDGRFIERRYVAMD